MAKNDKDLSGFVRVRGAREHNLKNVNLDIPRDALVVFTGISGSGKSFCVRHIICRSAKTLPGIGIALCPPVVQPNGHP